MTRTSNRDRLDARAAQRGLRVQFEEGDWNHGSALIGIVWRGSVRITGASLQVWGRTITDQDREELALDIGRLLWPAAA